MREEILLAFQSVLLLVFTVAGIACAPTLGQVQPGAALESQPGHMGPAYAARATVGAPVVFTTTNYKVTLEAEGAATLTLEALCPDEAPAQPEPKEEVQ